MWKSKILTGVLENSEAVVQRCSLKKVFLKISQNSQENTCTRVSFSIKLQAQTCEFCEILKNTFFYRAPPVAASENSHSSWPKTLSTDQVSRWSCSELQRERVLLFYTEFLKIEDTDIQFLF